ncbi:MAG: proteasome subunit beta, partial [Acidimicrobiaceae bacterium]|nr:proteasome subunit beta [Acidimicrobiaceae bacterium]
MTLPTFAPGDDPGPDFVGLLTRLGVGSFESTVVFDPAQITHGTTVLAIRYSDGVLMAGDRRATSGHLISHRSIEKVFPADSSSGVAIAGAAGPAIEMVRLFQLQLEHYEKVEGTTLTLDGKANQLSQMLRNHLPAAMQGLAVVPLFAGFDSRTEQGRLFQFDVTGGRYEERDYAAIGSGGLHAATVMKLRHQPGIGADEAIDVAIEAMFQAADEDIATGGPDTVRGIYPVVALITAD